ncbi:MAG: prepilin-type N-terminal cleavage/methylation domain-containing protein [Sedimentisphaerales bacterium]|nr:prepilin-type N-terminal cleavage/methylation domain-containing protein [Sedimentisphaerales bacterium]
MTVRKGRISAFTFVEVMIALVIVSISLMALLRLHLISVQMVEKAQIMTQAVQLANEKIAETLTANVPEEGVRSGAVEKNGLTLNWKTRVEDVQSIQWDTGNMDGLRRVLVDISWKQGRNRKHLEMSTFVADRALP